MTQVQTTSRTPPSTPQPAQEQARPIQSEQGAQQKFAEAMKKDGKKAGAEKEWSGALREEGKSGALREEGKSGSLSASEESPFSVLRRRPGEGNKESPAGESPFSALGRRDAEKSKDSPAGEFGRGAIPNGDAVLAALGGTQPRGPEAAGAPAPAALDPVLTGKLVDRILVSAPEAGGPAEVRISLREDVLPGTEVRIQRLPDGGIKVQFVTDNPQAERQLNQTQLTGLQQALGESLRAEVRVSTVRTDGSMTSDSGTGGGRERGGDGQDAQGDSRQRSRQFDLYRGEDA